MNNSICVTTASDETAASDLLRTYAAADSDADAASHLNLLFEQFITPWCREAARHTLRQYGIHGADRAEDEAEVVADTLLQLTARLQELRRGRSAPIANLRGYAITAVYNSCFARIRQRYPGYIRLQNQVRYLLREDRDFADWKSSQGDQRAGLAAWQGREDVAAISQPPLRTSASLRNLLRNVLERAGGPLRLTELTAWLAESLGVDDLAHAALSPEHPGTEPRADRLMMQRQELETLWREVLQLPAPQRAALLLNLRDANGHGVIELIPATGTATFAQLADVLSLSAVELARIWPDLPIDDARIAELLRVTRQQVINLRKSARSRLARRQSAGGGNGGGNMARIPASEANR
jgi:DNA-directed RNA polymerase specialized sigma24 family protein